MKRILLAGLVGMGLAGSGCHHILLHELHHNRLHHGHGVHVYRPAPVVVHDCYDNPDVVIVDNAPRRVYTAPRTETTVRVQVPSPGKVLRDAPKPHEVLSDLHKAHVKVFKKLFD